MLPGSLCGRWYNFTETPVCSLRAGPLGVGGHPWGRGSILGFQPAPSPSAPSWGAGSVGAGRGGGGREGLGSGSLCVRLPVGSVGLLEGGRGLPGDGEGEVASLMGTSFSSKAYNQEKHEKQNQN